MRLYTFGTMAMTATAVAVLCGATAAPPALSASDLQQKFAEGDYAGVIAGSGRLLAATGAAAASADKGPVYALKAESHLHLKQFAQAGDAFARAAKASTDPAAVATDTAMAALIKKSHNGAYVPKHAAADGAKPSPIDITSAADRKPALAALFADEFATDEPKLKAAATSTSVPSIQAAADTAATLRDVEVAATDGDEKTKPLVDALVSHAHDLLDAPVKSMAQQVEKVKTAADAPPAYGRRVRVGAGTGGGGEPSQMKTGLSSEARSEMQNVVTNAQRIAVAADALAKATDEPKGAAAKRPAAGDDGAAPAGDAGGGGTLDALAVEAKKVATDAAEVLNANYGHPGAMASGRGTRPGR